MPHGFVMATLVELPYLIVESLIGVNITYWMIGLNMDFTAYIFFVIIYFLYVSALTCLGMLFSALAPDVQSGTLMAALFTNIMNLFAGVQVPPDKIPNYYTWLYWMSPQRWAQEAVIATQFYGDTSIICNPNGVQVPHSGLALNMTSDICTVDGSFNPALGLKQVTGQAVEAGVYVLEQFLNGYEYDFRYYDIVVLASWILASRILLLVVLTNISHLKR